MDGRAVGRFGEVVPLPVLDLAEVRTVEQLLQARDLCSCAAACWTERIAFLVIVSLSPAHLA